MSEESLNVVITAVDNASATIQKIQESLVSLNSTAMQVQNGVTTLSAATDKQAVSLNTLDASNAKVVQGITALNAATTAMTVREQQEADALAYLAIVRVQDSQKILEEQAATQSLIKSKEAEENAMRDAAAVIVMAQKTMADIFISTIEQIDAEKVALEQLAEATAADAEVMGGVWAEMEGELVRLGSSAESAVAKIVASNLQEKISQEDLLRIYQDARAEQELRIAQGGEILSVNEEETASNKILGESVEMNAVALTSLREALSGAQGATIQQQAAQELLAATTGMSQKAFDSLWQSIDAGSLYIVKIKGEYIDLGETAIEAYQRMTEYGIKSLVPEGQRIEIIEAAKAEYASLEEEVAVYSAQMTAFAINNAEAMVQFSSSVKDTGESFTILGVKVEATFARIAVRMGIVFAIMAMISFLKDATKAAEDENNTEQELANTLVGTQEQRQKDFELIQQQTKALADKSLFSVTEIENANKLVVAYGATADQSTKVIAALAPLIELKSTAKNADQKMEEGTKAVTEALDGHTKSLEKLGITFTANDEKIISNGTQLQKLQVITDEAAKAAEKHGNIVENTYSMQLKKATEQVEEHKISIGEHLLPIMSAWEGTLASMLMVLDMLISELSMVSHVILDVVVAAIQTVIGYWDMLSTSAKDAGQIMKDVFTGNWAALGADEKKFFDDQAANNATYVKNVTKTAKDGLDTMKNWWKEEGDIMNGKFNAKIDISGSNSGGGLGGGAESAAATDALKKAMDEAAKAIKDLKDKATDDLRTLGDEHGKFVDTISAKISGLMNDYSDLSKKGSDELAKLAQANKDSLASIDKSIADTEEKISELAEKFATDTAANVTTLADAFVKAKEDAAKLKDELDNWKVSDAIGKTQLSILKLQESLTGETNTTKANFIQEEIDQQKVSLAYELDAEAQKKQAVQDNYDTQEKTLTANADLAITYATQIAAAQTQADAGALQKAVDTFNQKKIMLQETYTDEQTKLNQELADEQTKRQAEIDSYNQKVLDTTAATALALSKKQEEITAAKTQMATEQTLYDEKVKAINKTVADAETERQQAEATTHKQVLADVQAEIQTYKDLAAAISQANSANFSNQVSAASSGAPHVAPVLPSIGGQAVSGPVMPHADGGITNGPSIGLIGEAGPEAIIPLSKMDQVASNWLSPRLNTSNNSNSSVNVVVNINGGVVDESFIEKIGDRLTRMLKMSTATV